MKEIRSTSLQRRARLDTIEENDTSARTEADAKEERSPPKMFPNHVVSPSAPLAGFEEHLARSRSMPDVMRLREGSAPRSGVKELATPPAPASSQPRTETTTTAASLTSVATAPAVAPAPPAPTAVAASALVSATHPSPIGSMIASPVTERTLFSPHDAEAQTSEISAQVPAERRSDSHSQAPDLEIGRSPESEVASQAARSEPGAAETAPPPPSVGSGHPQPSLVGSSDHVPAADTVVARMEANLAKFVPKPPAHGTASTTPRAARTTVRRRANSLQGRDVILFAEDGDEEQTGTEATRWGGHVPKKE